MEKGLYYGRNKGFFPQNIVYVHIEKDTAYVECFLPLKGGFFKTFEDTLIYKNDINMFCSIKSSIVFDKKKIIFSTLKSEAGYQVASTNLQYQPDKKKEYDDIRTKSKPF